MTEMNHDPVALPPGSFDAAELDKHLDKAAKAKPETRDEMLSTGLEKLNRRDAETNDPRHIPGTKFVTVERELAPGVKVEETIQVNDPDHPAEPSNPERSTKTIAADRTTDAAEAASKKD